MSYCCYLCRLLLCELRSLFSYYFGVFLMQHDWMCSGSEVQRSSPYRKVHGPMPDQKIDVTGYAQQTQAII
ncbi:hypothetical protein Bca4012_062042 [Brassica carinata]